MKLSNFYNKGTSKIEGGVPFIMRTLDDWKVIIEDQKSSGLSISDFCKTKDISTASFYKNRKALSNDNDISFSKVEVVEDKPGKTIEFTLDGHRIKCDKKYLHVLLEAIL